MAGPLDEANALINSPVVAASQAGLPRRHTGQVVEREATAAENAVAEAQSAGTRALGYAPAVVGLARQVTGDQAGAQQAYRTSAGFDESADRIGAESSAPTDWRDVDGVESGLAYARRLAIGSAPDMLTSLGAGAVGRGLARRTAMNLERTAIADRVAANIASGVESPLTRKVAARQAAEGAIPASQAVADAQAREAIQEVAGEAVSRGAGMGRVDAAGRAGALAGAAAGQFPGLVSESREELEKTDQQGALTIAGFDAAAAAVGALPAERLLGRIASNPAARQAIDAGLARQLAGRAGRAAKDTLTQAGLEGTTEVAQAALQRAGHSFVDSNIRMLSPDAIDDYVANFIGGAVLGGITGGAVEGANATVGGVADTARWVRDRSGPARDMIRDRIAEQTAKAAARVQRPSAAGESMGVEGGQASAAAPDTRTAAERFQSMVESGADAARGLADRVVPAVQAARSRFEETMRGFTSRDDIEARTDAVFDELEASLDTPRAANDAPVLDKATSFTQKWLLSKVDPMFLNRASEGDALRLGRVLEKYATGKELSRREATTLSRVVDNPNSGITQRQLDMFTGLGPSIAVLSSRMSDTAGAEQAAPQLKQQAVADDADAVEVADAVQEAELASAAAARGPLRETAGERQEQRFARLDELNQVIARGIQRPEQMPATTADKRAAFRQSRSEVAAARKERAELQEAVTSSVLGNQSPTQKRANGEPVRSNVFDENRSPQGQKRWAEAEASPNYVQLADTWSLDGSDRPAAQRRTMLNIPFAVEAQLARHGNELGSDQQQRGEAAFKMMLAEAQAAGINIDLSTLSPGDVMLQKRGRPEAKRLFTITPALISQLTTNTDTPAQVAQRRQRITLRMAERPNTDQAPLPARDRKFTAEQGRALVAANRAELAKGLGKSEKRLVNSIYSRMMDDARKADPNFTTNRASVTRLKERAAAELARRRATIGRQGVTVEQAAREAGGNELEQADTRTLVPRETPQGSEARAVGTTSGAGDFVSENTPLVTGALAARPELDKVVDRMRRNFAGSLDLELQQEAANRRYRQSAEGKAMLKALDANTVGATRVSEAEAELATAIAQLNGLEGTAAKRKADAAKAAEVAAGAAARRAYAEAFNRVAGSDRSRGPSGRLDRLLATPAGQRAAAQVDAIVRDKAAGVEGAAEQMRALAASNVVAKQYIQLMRAMATDHRVIMAAAAEAASVAADQARARTEAELANTSVLKPAAKAAVKAARERLAAVRTEYGVAADAYEKAKAAYESGGKASVPVYTWSDVAKAIARTDLRDQLADNRISQETYNAEMERVAQMPDSEAYGYVELATSGGSITHAKAESSVPLSSDGAVDPTVRLLRRWLTADAEVVTPGGTAIDALADAFGIAFTGARAGASPEQRAAAMRLINTVSALADGTPRDADGNYTDRLFDAYEVLSRARLRGDEVSAHDVAVNRGTGVVNLDSAAATDAGGAAQPNDGQLAAESTWANRVLAMMGVESKVTVGVWDKNPTQGAHQMKGNTARIMLGNGLRGGERMEVLAHEMGHHVVFDYLQQRAKAAGFEAPTLAQLGRKAEGQTSGSLNMIEAVDPELGAALRTDYEKWYRTLNPRTTLAAMRASRSPILRSASIGALPSSGTPLGKLTRESLQYQVSFDEWLADNVARALLHRREVTDAMSATTRFFTELANKLRQLYDSLIGNGYRPAESVEAWVADMFAAAPKALQTVTESPTQPSAAQTQAVTEAAVVASHAPAVADGPGAINEAAAPPSEPPAAPSSAGSDGKPPRDFEGMMRYVRDFLPPQERQILEQAFSRETAHQRLREVYKNRPDVQRAMTDAATGMEARIAAGYLAWQGGKMNVGPQSRSVMVGIGDILREYLGVASNATYAHKIMNDITSGKVARFKETGRLYDSVASERRGRGIRQQAVDRASDVATKVWRPFERLLDSNLARMNSSGIPAYRAIGAALYKPTGASGSDVGYVRAVAHTTARFSARAAQAMEGLSEGQQRRVMRLLQEQASTERLNATVTNESHINHGKPVYSPAVRRAFREVRGLMNEAFQYLEQAGVKVGYRKDFFPLMLDLRNERAEQRLTELLSKPEYEQAIRDLYKDRPRSTPTPKRARVERNVPDLDPKAEAYFARQRERLQERAKATNSDREADSIAKVIEVNQSVVEAMRTGNVATIEKHLAAAQTRRSRYADDSDAAKVIDLEMRFARSRIEQLKAVPAAPAAQAQPEGPASNSPIADMIADLVQGARRNGVPFGNVDLSEGAPNFRSANFRFMEFIHRLRDEAVASGDAATAAMHEANVREFAALQVKDPAEAFSRYFEPAVRRAEYARRFGDDGGKLTEMLEQMTAQGADAAQVKHARQSVEAAVGAYGRDMSPTIAAVSPALAQRLSGERTRATIAGLQTYQNSRNLVLGLLSSVVDPMGIAVRSGGDFATAWKGFQTGIKSLGDKATREEIHSMLQMLGSTSDMGSTEVLNHAFGGAGSPTTAKVNDFIFKWNGMAAWTRATRYMALVSGHEFMLKHATANSDMSRRYRDELGLQKGDVSAVTVTGADGTVRRQVKLLSPEELAKASPEAKAADARVKQALVQFVDESILRPNSQQVPLWHSDPYMSLLSQYKAFSYAIYEQIMGRVNLELQNGNSKVVLAALAYVPIVIAAELLRNVFQGDSEDTEDWGPGEYLALGVERSGLYSPRLAAAEDVVSDLQARRTPGSSMVGPTVSQARNVSGALQGRRDLGKEFEAALPGSALYKKWNDESRAAAPETEA